TWPSRPAWRRLSTGHTRSTRSAATSSTRRSSSRRSARCSSTTRISRPCGTRPSRRWSRRPALAEPIVRQVVTFGRVLREAGLEEAGTSAEGDERASGWSAQELLRDKDFSELTPEELARVRRMIAELALARPQRRSRRLRRHRQGSTLDLRRLVRASLATGGD